MTTLFVCITALLSAVLPPPSLGHYEVRKAIVVDNMLLSDCRGDAGSASIMAYDLWTISIPAGEPERLSRGMPVLYGHGVPTWGLAGGDFFLFPYQSLPHSQSHVPMASRGERKMYLEAFAVSSDGRMPSMEVVDAIMNRTKERWLFLSPLRNSMLWETDDFGSNFDASFDFGFSSPRDGALLIVRDGKFWEHSLDDEQERDRAFWNEGWTEVGPVPTTITGAFRAMRSGHRLVLVDQRGAVYSTPREGHALIGRIANWPTEEQVGTRAVYLLEDAATHHLRVLEVIDDLEDPEKKKVIALSFNLEEGQKNSPFHAEMPSEDVQRALIRLTEAIDEAREK